MKIIVGTDKPSRVICRWCDGIEPGDVKVILKNQYSDLLFEIQSFIADHSGVRAGPNTVWDKFLSSIGYEATVILVSFLIEQTFSEFLAIYLEKIKRFNREQIKQYLKTPKKYPYNKERRGPTPIEALYSKVFEEELGLTLCDNGYDDFYTGWNAVRNFRNSCAHDWIWDNNRLWTPKSRSELGDGTWRTAPRLDLRRRDFFEALRLAGDAERVFAFLWNRHCKGKKTRLHSRIFV